jgi:alkylation response protein AidB-like acyl-CoA dehydrogenase
MDPAGARAIYGPDPSIVIAGCLQPPGEAVVVDGGYRVSGRWPFASGCTHSAWLFGICQVIEHGAPRLLPNGQPERRTVYMPADQVEIIDTWHTTGLRGTGSHDICVREVLVPEERTYLAGAPFGQAPGSGPLYRAFPLLPAIEGAFALGVAQRALDTFVELAAVKTAFGATVVLNEQAHVQETAARAHALLRSARHWLYGAERELWEAVLAGDDGTPQQRADARLATVHAMHSAVAAVDLIHRAAGTTAIYARSPIERCFRDLHTAEADVAVGRGVVRTAGRVVLGLPANDPNF